MRVTFLLTQSLESPGGGGRYLPLAKALVRRGFSVVMVALHHNYSQATKRKFVVDGVEVRYVAQMHVKKTGNVKTYFSPTKLAFITLWATLKLFWEALWIPSDVVLVCKTQPMNGVAAWLLHVLLNKHVVLDSDDFESINNRFSGRWQQKLVAWFENWMPTFASGMTVGNSFIAQRYKALGYPANQITVLPNGVERDFFTKWNGEMLSDKLADLRAKWEIHDSQRVIVYVGSMSLVSHAVDLLFEAFSRVIAKNPAVLLLMVGAGEDFVKLQQLAESMNLRGHIKFVGKVPFSEVVYYYHLAELSVDPRRQSIPAESSLSLKLLESIAAGTPCVTADIGDRKEIIQDAGLAVPPDNAEQLAEGILKILEEPELALSMRQAALIQRETNWWEQRVDLLIEQFPSAL